MTSLLFRFSRRARRSSDQRGQSLVEFALILPLALMIAMGVLDFGRAMYAYVAISNVAQAGAEYASRHPSYNASDITNAGLNEGGAFIQSQAADILILANEENGSQVRVVRVTARYTFRPINPALFGLELPIQAIAAAPKRAS